MTERLGVQVPPGVPEDIMMNDISKQLLVFLFKHDGVLFCGESIVVAHNKYQAIQMLNESLRALKVREYSGEYDSVVEIDPNKPKHILINDGDLH
jgi:hypothetical protein